jgi:hypothetical protein
MNQNVVLGGEILRSDKRVSTPGTCGCARGAFPHQYLKLKLSRNVV